MSQQCLSIPEIVYQICGALETAANPFRRPDRNILSMALTCRDFLEPALDALWKTLSSHRQIAACLPEDLFRVKEQRFEGDIIDSTEDGGGIRHEFKVDVMVRAVVHMRSPLH